MDKSRSIRVVTVVAILAATIAVYGQLRGHAFLSLDDPLYVRNNRIVQGGLTAEGAGWAFSTPSVGNWHPLTWLSHMADVSLFGMDPGRHLLVNVAFHAANTLLLLFLLYRMTGGFGRSAFVAALFALHPLHVESVAWISERKDVLSGFFFLATLIAYVRYCRKPGWKAFVPVVLLFALGLMAKPMLVTLPFVLLLLDYWPLRRTALSPDPVDPVPYRRLATEKSLLFLMSLGSCIVTAIVQARGGAMKSLDAIPMSARLLNIPVAYVRYLGKTVLPVDLAVEYPHPGSALPAWEAAAALLFLAAVSFLAIRAARRHPSLPVGWFWFLGMMVPVIGLVQVGGQAMADRYTYLPLIGVFLPAAWMAWEQAAPLPRRALLLGIPAAVVLLALGSMAHRQAGYWRDSATLYRHALEVNPDNPTVLTNLGGEMGAAGRYEEAVRFSRAALALRPNLTDARFNLALYLELGGSLQEAAIQYGELLRRTPGDREAAYNLQRVMFRLKGGSAETVAD